MLLLLMGGIWSGGVWNGSDVHAHACMCGGGVKGINDEQNQRTGGENSRIAKNCFLDANSCYCAFTIIVTCISLMLDLDQSWNLKGPKM